MNILAIDAAGRRAGVAVLQDGALLYECNMGAGFTHSETLLPMVDAALKACALTPADISVYGVTAGPGSFTGLRIGLAAVKGLAFTYDTPCAPVSTLEALAATHSGSGTVVCALDARRRQIYRAAFDLETHERLLPDEAVAADTLADFVAACKKPLIFIGDGAALCYNQYGSEPGVLAVPQAVQVSRAAGVALAAQRMAEAGELVSPAALMPEYHRLSQAERERAAKLAAEENQ